MKSVLITGASRGIGKHIATHFAEQGHDIAITAIDEVELRETARELSDIPESGRVEWYLADSSEESEVRRVVEGVNDTYDGVDILVNNAGRVGPIGKFHTNDLSDWKRTVRTNLFGMVNYSHYILPGMLDQEYGRIVNILGGGARSSRPTLSGYGTSKAATLRFTTSVGEELEGTNVRMNGVGPGVVATDLIEEIRTGGGLADEYAERLTEKVEENKTTDPRKLSRFVEFLARPELKETGAIWEVDEWEDPGDF